jgi:predicted RNA-binding Zn-ribbon protein involved in translation (DUF1610 family)
MKTRAKAASTKVASKLHLAVILAWLLLNEVVILFKIHTNDGLTSRIDLSDEAQAAEWVERSKDPSFQEKITGISIIQKCLGHFKCPKCGKSNRLVCSHCGQPAQETACGTGIQYSLSKPSDFDKTYYLVERIEPDAQRKIRGGERITCFVGNVKLAMMVHSAQSSARVTLFNTGKQRYNPYT